MVFGMSDSETVRRLALSLPDTQEVEQFGTVSFRVRGKIFAQFSKDQSEILVKLAAPLQTSLITAEPDIFISEPHWGGYGWTRIRLATLPVETLRPLLVQSWRLIGPKTMARDPADPPGDSNIVP